MLQVLYCVRLVNIHKKTVGYRRFIIDCMSLQIGIEVAPFIMAYPRSTELNPIKCVKPDNARLDQEEARLVSVREGIGIVIYGFNELDGAGYTVAIRAIDAGSGEQIATSRIDAASVAGLLSIATSNPAIDSSLFQSCRNPQWIGHRLSHLSAQPLYPRMRCRSAVS